MQLVAGEEKILAATPYSLFAYDLTENSIERFSRVTGLNETGIAGLALEPVSGKILVAYANSNLDILFQNQVINIPDIKREQTTLDKRIYRVQALQGQFYLSTGLGVIQVDPDRYEIRSTWRLGSSGQAIRIHSLQFFNGLFYAATAEGLKRQTVAGSDPSFFGNWQLESGLNGLPPGECQQVVAIGNRIIARVNEVIYARDVSGTWTAIYSAPGWVLRSLDAGTNSLLISQTQSGNGRVVEINLQGNTVTTFSSGLSDPQMALRQNGVTWVADRVKSLWRFSGSLVETIRPGSPDSIATGNMIVAGDRFLAASGSGDNGLYQFQTGVWTNYNGRQFPPLDTMQHLVVVTGTNNSDTLWVGSDGDGLIRIAPNNVFSIFKQNSPLAPSLAAPDQFRVVGLALDNEDNLWIANEGAATRVQVRKRDGNWNSFDPPFSGGNRAMGPMVIDPAGQVWIISRNGNGLYCFRPNQTIDNTNDDQWKWFRLGAGQGNLPSNRVLSLAIDKSGFVWIGTDDGIGVVQCPEQVFGSPACEALLPVVQQGNFAGFLFKGEAIRSIAVDGADRKWIATANGVFLISSEGETILYQFNEANSPLLSNDVYQVTIDGNTGEVFFATANGICSFRSTATEGGPKHQSVLVYPNPVPPGYSGTIGIRGLAENSTVKITELDGRLVYQTRALGGQAIWDGKDYRGRRISTGVYLVLVSDGKKETQAARIVFISQ